MLSKFYLPVFYTGYFVQFTVQKLLLYCHQQSIKHSFQLRFVIYAGVDLTVLGAIGVFARLMGQKIMGKPMLYTSVCITFAVLTVFEYFAFWGKGKAYLDLVVQDKKEFAYLYWFLNLNVVYIFFQTFLCSTNRVINVEAYFLMCTNLVSLVFIGGYLVSISTILKSVGAEDSYKSLSYVLEKSGLRVDNLREFANYDSLTKAYSRVYLLQKIALLLEDRVLFSLVYLDLDGQYNLLLRSRCL